MIFRCSALYSAVDSPGRTRSPCCRYLRGGAISFATDRPQYRSGALKSSVFGVPVPDADSSVAARVAVFVADSEFHLLRNSEQLYDSQNCTLHGMHTEYDQNPAKNYKDIHKIFVLQKKIHVTVRHSTETPGSHFSNFKLQPLTSLCQHVR
jgi:hypothetical protein